MGQLFAPLLTVRSFSILILLLLLGIISGMVLLHFGGGGANDYARITKIGLNRSPLRQNS